MSPFFGKYSYTVDQKGRMNIPAKFRKVLSPEANDTFISIRGIDQCLFVYPLDVWKERIVKKVEQLTEVDKNHRYFIREMASNASESTLDKLGRIVVPTELCKLAKINREVLIIGAFHRIELWNPEIYNLYSKGSEQTYEEIAEAIMFF